MRVDINTGRAQKDIETLLTGEMMKTYLAVNGNFPYIVATQVSNTC